jgi:hypothetical protein
MNYPVMGAAFTVTYALLIIWERRLWFIDIMQFSKVTKSEAKVELCDFRVYALKS